MVERQPGHEDVVGLQPPGHDDGVEVGAKDSLREHHALGFGRGATGELEDRQPVEILWRARVAGGTAKLRGAGQVVEPQHRRVTRFRFDEGGQLGIDQEQGGVGLEQAGTRLPDELLDRREPHRQREHHERGAGEPGCLDGGDERARGRPEDRNVRVRAHAEGLELGGHGAGLVVQLAPRDVHDGVG